MQVDVVIPESLSFLDAKRRNPGGKNPGVFQEFNMFFDTTYATPIRL